MSYVVVARKWRPQKFEEVVGQAHIARTLQNAIRNNRIAHAYLFTGVRGVGKTTVARIFAKALNCERGPTPTPCNECGHCKEITQGNSIDVREIDGASNRGIDEVRQIIENVRYQPAKCRFKIYIIDEVHQVTRDAFNALLKTLEEPPESVKFFLATTEPHRLPETILSRCQRFDFRRIPLREIVRCLGDIAKREGLTLTDGVLLLLAREAEGSMRDAQSLLEQILVWAEPVEGQTGQAYVDEKLLQEVLGLAPRQVLHEISGAVIKADAKRCLELVGEVVSQGWDLGKLSRELVEHFRNLLVARLALDEADAPVAKSLPAPPDDQLLDLTDQEIEDLKGQVKELSTETLLDYFDFMSRGDEEISRSATPRFLLESVLVRLATLPHTLPVSELLERLERLEGKLSGPAKGTVVKEGANRPAPLATRPPEDGVEPIDRNENTWRDLVNFIGKEKKLLASHLESAIAMEMAPGRLKIGVAERHQLSYLQDSDNLLALKNLAGRFFSEEVTVEIAVMATDQAPRGETFRPQTATGTPKDHGQTVNEALRIFGGSIRRGSTENG
jgi:DNA polymerase-3 subunit gamma/tau